MVGGRSCSTWTVELFVDTSKAWLFLLVNLLVVVIATGTASAQPTEMATVAATSSQMLMERGVLGIVTVLEGVVIFLLFKDLKQQHEKTLEWAVKATDVLATAMAGAQKAEGVSVKAVEQLIKNDMAIARNEAMLQKNEATLQRIVDKLDSRGSGGSRDGD